MQQEDEDDAPFLVQAIGFILGVILAILFIVLTILTLGIFLPDDNEPKKQSATKIASREERLRVSLQRKKNRFTEVSKTIRELEPIIHKIRKTEKRVLFTSRLIVACLLIGANFYFLKSNGLLRDITFPSLHRSLLKPDFIDHVVNFNGLILILYGLPAYILYGTTARLTSSMKDKIIRILRKKHIHTFTELQKLREEEKTLKQEITHLNTLLLEYV